jgi:prepilin-type N-terminal cleavage/methylation domain-containing protein
MPNIKHQFKSQSGFTLMELLVYIAIIAITLTITSVITFEIIQAKQKSEITRETQENTRFILQRMTREIRWASSILNFAPNDITLNTDMGPVRFYLGGVGSDQLFIEKGGVSYELTTNKVKITNLTMTRITPPNAPESIQINITAENRIVSAKGEYTGKTNLVTAASLREE